MLKNIEKFKKQNTRLKNIIKHIDDKAYDSRSWIVGFQKIFREKSKVLENFSEIMKKSNKKANIEWDNFIKFKNELNRFYDSINWMPTSSWIKFEDFQKLWKKNNDEKENPDIHKCVKYFTEEEIEKVKDEMKTIVNTFLQDNEDLEKSLDDVWEFAKQEINNYEHYANFKNYYQYVKTVEEEKIQELGKPPENQYIDQISYVESAKEIKNKNDKILR